MKQPISLDQRQIGALIDAAIKARAYAYAPYSGFLVGAALLDEQGQMHTGCNIENAAYTPSVCAERTALFSAVAKGIITFRALAVVGARQGENPGYVTPCGVCRQVLSEFCPPDMPVIAAESDRAYRIYTLGQLLPHHFGPDHLREGGGK